MSILIYTAEICAMEFQASLVERRSRPVPLLVNVKEAGRLLGGIGQTKVYDLLKKRELPFVKIGRSTRIELAAIQAFIERERIGSKPRVNR